jgi:hypothetical protein
LSESAQLGVEKIFLPREVAASESVKFASLLTAAGSRACPGSGLLGTTVSQFQLSAGAQTSRGDTAAAQEGTSQPVYLNVNDPFALITVGVQGAGKSHTTAVVLENCLLPCPIPHSQPLVRLAQPMAALVLHFDQSTRWHPPLTFLSNLLNHHLSCGSFISALSPLGLHGISP